MSAKQLKGKLILFERLEFEEKYLLSRKQCVRRVFPSHSLSVEAGKASGTPLLTLSPATAPLRAPQIFLT